MEIRHTGLSILKRDSQRNLQEKNGTPSIWIGAETILKSGWQRRTDLWAGCGAQANPVSRLLCSKTGTVPGMNHQPTNFPFQLFFDAQI